MRIPTHSQRGVTLLEAMIAVAVLAVIVGIATPSFTTLLAAQRVKNNASDLFSDMQLARSEALSRMANVTIAPKNASWSNGWTIQVGVLVLKDKPLPGNITISKATGSDDQVVFGSNGRTSGTFLLNFAASGLSNENQKRCIKSDSAGGTKLIKGAC